MSGSYEEGTLRSPLFEHALTIVCRQLVGSRETALETLQVIRQVVLRSRSSNIEELISTIKTVGRRLSQAQPKGEALYAVKHVEADKGLHEEFTVGNTVRKILHHIREEYNAAHPSSMNPKSGRSISNFILMGQPKQHIPHPRPQAAASNVAEAVETEANEADSSAQGLKPVLMEAIQDVLDELETVYDNIAKNAKDHIHSE